MIVRAASFNDAVSEPEARALYEKTDCGPGTVVKIRGQRFMVPNPEYFGRYCAYQGNIGLLIFNVRAALPLL